MNKFEKDIMKRSLAVVYMELITLDDIILIKRNRVARGALYGAIGKRIKYKDSKSQLKVE